MKTLKFGGFEHAIRGMRNPLASWNKSDSMEKCVYESIFCDECNCGDFGQYHIGHKDLELMKKLYKAGTSHRKYARQIFVSMDITSHHGFWLDFDTYKVGVVKNSCSKMHRIHVKPFDINDFSHEGIDEVGGETKIMFLRMIGELEALRKLFNETQEKKYWRAMLELLPLGYNLKATVTMSYENVFNIIEQRSNHKWFEFREFCKILKGLPYIKEIMSEE